MKKTTENIFIKEKTETIEVGSQPEPQKNIKKDFVTSIPGGIDLDDVRNSTVGSQPK